LKVYTPEKIRNVALVGHNSSGKTTLAEAMLFRAGAIERLGRVEDGSTVFDYDPEEHKRQMALSLSMSPLEWHGHKVNLIDTPGYADFFGDVHAALRVADLAVFVVSAVEGVEVQTENAWRLAESIGIPRMIFVNKLDKERANYDRTLEQLRDRFGAGVAPLELPIGDQEAFHGVADLLTDKAYFYDSGTAEEGDIPEEMEEREHQIHDNLVEGIVVADDDLLERYLEGAARLPAPSLSTGS
jgi:elongation factor G